MNTKTYIKSTKLILALLLIAMTGCANLRSIGNNETYFLEPAKCDNGPGVVKRSYTVQKQQQEVCYRKTIIGAKDDAHVRIEKDGAIYDIDNSGHPSFAHDLASTVQAIAIQKAMDND